MCPLLRSLVFVPVEYAFSFGQNHEAGLGRRRRRYDDHKWCQRCCHDDEFKVSHIGCAASKTGSHSSASLINVLVSSFFVVYLRIKSKQVIDTRGDASFVIGHSKETHVRLSESARSGCKQINSSRTEHSVLLIDTTQAKNMPQRHYIFIYTPYIIETYLFICIIMYDREKLR